MVVSGSVNILWSKLQPHLQNGLALQLSLNPCFQHYLMVTSPENHINYHASRKFHQYFVA
jgi:hypothetical protein